MDLQESLVSWRQVIGMLRVEIRLWSSSWVVRRPLQLNWRMKGLPGDKSIEKNFSNGNEKLKNGGMYNFYKIYTPENM